MGVHNILDKLKIGRKQTQHGAGGSTIEKESSSPTNVRSPREGGGIASPGSERGHSSPRGNSSLTSTSGAGASTATPTQPNNGPASPPQKPMSPVSPATKSKQISNDYELNTGGRSSSNDDGSTNTPQLHQMGNNRVPIMEVSRKPSERGAQQQDPSLPSPATSVSVGNSSISPQIMSPSSQSQQQGAAPLLIKKSKKPPPMFLPPRGSEDISMNIAAMDPLDPLEADDQFSINKDFGQGMGTGSGSGPGPGPGSKAALSPGQGAGGKKPKRPPKLIAVGVNVGGDPEEEQKEEVFRNDGTFNQNGFQISKDGIVNRPGTIERRISTGSSLDGVPRSPHAIVEINSLEEIAPFRQLGAGASGRVYLAEHKPSNKYLAIKVVNVYDEPKRTQLMKELETLTTYVSRFLVRFYGAFYDGNGGVHIALEYMDCGALCDVVTEFGAVPENVANHIAFHCLLGLKFLHDSHVLHRDFKTANILLSRQTVRAKLSDFGLARDVNPGVSQANTFVGTIAYMSPERLHGSHYTYASDIWGLGVSIAECLLGKYPFEKPQSYFDYIEATMTENLLPRGRFSKECESFIRLCANVDPKKRPKTETLLKHPWIANANRSTEEFANWLDNILVEQAKRK